MAFPAKAIQSKKHAALGVSPAERRKAEVPNHANAGRTPLLAKNDAVRSAVRSRPSHGFWSLLPTVYKISGLALFGQ